MAQLLETFQANATVRSLARFLVVGMLGTIIDFSLFALMNVLFGVPTLAANTLSYSAGIINNYFFHRYWTFVTRPHKAAGKQFSQFVGVSLSALVINNLLVLLFTSWFSTLFSDTAIGAVFAKAFAIGVGMIWNFLANHLWTFRAN
jgi:putative flippase GtrA